MFLYSASRRFLANPLEAMAACFPLKAPAINEIIAAISITKP